MSAELEPSPLQSLRRDRIAACFLESMPSTNEMNRARARFLRARASQRRFGTKALLITVVQGMVLGLASAATAAFVADQVNRHDSPAGTSPAATPPIVTAAPDRARTIRAKNPTSEAPAPNAQPPRAAFLDLPSAATTVEKPAAPSQSQPRARVVRQDSLRTPRAEAVPPHSPAKANPLHDRGAGGSAAFPAVAAPPIGPWERVAKALEAGDWRGADTALNDLTGSDDAHARDAAALARAQLWITRGRGSEARSTLEQLAQHGKTPLIRRRAAALLSGL